MSDHTIDILEDYGFTRAVCSCGWTGTGFRNRASARAQAQEHVDTSQTTR